MFINLQNNYSKVLKLGLLVGGCLSAASIMADSFIDPVKDGRYRSANNKMIFGSSTDDKYRIPALEQMNNGDIVFFAERRIDALATNDYKRQSIVMRTLNKSSGKLNKGRQILLNTNAPGAKADGNSFKHNLMNPVPVYNRETGVLHLFYNHIITSGSEKLRANVMHSKSSDNGASWSTPVDLTSTWAEECETLIVGPGRAIQIPAGEPNAGRILVPLHTIDVLGKAGTKYAKPSNCNSTNSIATGQFKAAISDDDAENWSLSNHVNSGVEGTYFTEKQIVYVNGKLHMFSRLGGENEYDGSGLAYSVDGGTTWLRGFNENGPKNDAGENIGVTGRFVTPTQSGLATEGEHIYYTTSVFYSWYEGLDNRREAWTHRIDPEAMLSKDYSPINVVQPITKSGFSNVATLYLGDNKIGVMWEEVRTWKPIKRIRNIFYTVIDTRDFRDIEDPTWVNKGFDYFPVWNGSHHLFDTEMNGENKTSEWNPN
jgi:sialidase-1